MKGKIKNLNDKGFGFITPDDGGKDIFFHANDLIKEDGGPGFNELQRDTPVTFEMGDSPKGPKAVEVRVIG